MSSPSIRRRRSRRQPAAALAAGADGAADARRLGRDGDDDGPAAAAARSPMWSAACSASPRSACWPPRSAATGSPKKAEMMAARREYLRHLAGLRRRVRDTADAAAGRRCSTGTPTRTRCGPPRTATGCGSAGPTDADFGVVRLARRPADAGHPAGPAGHPAAGGARADDRGRAAPVPRRVLGGARTCRSRSRCAASPGSSLRGGRRADARALTRAVLAQLAIFHAPDDLIIAVCAGAGAARRRGSGSSGCRTTCTRPRTDALGPVRLVASSGRRPGEAARGRDRQPAPVQPGRRRRPTARTW